MLHVLHVLHVFHVLRALHALQVSDVEHMQLDSEGGALMCDAELPLRLDGSPPVPLWLGVLIVLPWSVLLVHLARMWRGGSRAPKPLAACDASSLHVARDPVALQRDVQMEMPSRHELAVSAPS